MAIKYVVLTKDLINWEHFGKLSLSSKWVFGEFVRNTKRFQVIKTLLSEDKEEIFVLHDGLKMPKRFTRDWSDNKLVKI
ncbi:MAG: hypothetical protein ACRDDY_03720 [Clostridium sp.]|uniref:hypothetical protein n=1 Tax=Clostridium sp. TaxID=1506 RepID=UPI003EE49598